jgi:hypothetical protein
MAARAAAAVRTANEVTAFFVTRRFASQRIFRMDAPRGLGVTQDGNGLRTSR